MRTRVLVRVIAIAIACLVSSTALLADNQKNTFTGSIGFGSSCTSFINANGPFDVMVQTNTEGDSPMVSIHVRWKMDGSDRDGNDYSGSFMGNATFDSIEGAYEMPYHAVMVGKGKAPNVRFEGDIRISVTPSGRPVWASIRTFSATCQ